MEAEGTSPTGMGFSSRLRAGESAGAVVSTIRDYILDTLLDKPLLAKQRKKFTDAVNLPKRRRTAPYTEVSLLSSMALGLDVLDEALASQDANVKNLSLDHAEKILQICARLRPIKQAKTAGIPNSYIAAFAYLNLAYIYVLRDQDQRATRHILKMFLVDLRYTRLDFAPILWQRLFFPYLKQIMTWYLEQRHFILSDGQGSSFQPNYESQDVIRSCRQRPLSIMNSEQSIKMVKLENIYEVAMDENLRQYVLYYRALVKRDSALKKGIRFPTVEPPMDASKHVELLDSILFGFESFSRSSKDAPVGQMQEKSFT